MSAAARTELVKISCPGYYTGCIYGVSHFFSKKCLCSNGIAVPLTSSLGSFRKQCWSKILKVLIHHPMPAEATIDSEQPVT